MPSSQDVVYYAAGLGVYQLVYRLAECIMSRAMPKAYARLRSGSPKVYRTYFTMVIGLLISSITAPVCINAALSSATSPNDMSLAGQICVIPRAVMWSSELPLILHLKWFTLHHFMSLGSIALVLLKRVPLMPLYVIYAGLVAELFLNGLGMLRAHGYTRATSVIYKRLELLNGFVILLLRFLPAAAVTATYLFPRRSTAPSMQAYFACVVFYCGWTLFLAGRIFTMQGFIAIDRALPVQIRFAGGLRISAFGLFLGVAMMAAHAWTVTLYNRSGDLPLSTSQAREMAFMGLGTITAGLLSKKLSSPWIPRTLTGSCKAPILGKVASAALSIQGSLFLSSSSLLSRSQIAPSVDKALLLYCVGTSLPLGEAISRIGCRFSGCCGSRTTKNGRELVPHLQLLSACLNLTVFCLAATCISRGYTSVRVAGLCSVGANATIQLVLDPWQKDAKSRLAACQLLTSVLLLLNTERDVDEATSLISSLFGIASLAGIFVIRRLIAKTWIRLLQNGYAKSASSFVASRIGLPTLFVTLFSVGIIVLCCHSDAPPHGTHSKDVSRTHGSSPVLSSPSIINYAFATAVNPIVAMSTWSRNMIVGSGLLHYSGRADAIDAI